AVDETLCDLIDGVTDEALLDHLASCERCRDARHEAEQLSQLVADAAADYRWPADLGERLMRAVAALPAAEPPSAPAAPAPAAPASGPRSSTLPSEGARPSARWVWLSLAAAIGLGALWLGGRHEPGAPPPNARGTLRADAWQGQVSSVDRALGSPTGLSQCARGTQVCQPIGPGDIAHPGMRFETDGLTRARIRLADGSVLALDRLTRFELDPSERRRGRLLAGSVVAEIEPISEDAARGANAGASNADPASASATGVHSIIDVPFGRAEVLGTKFSLRAGDDGTRLEVSRGSVQLVDDAQGRSVLVNAGEAALLTGSAAPRVEPVSDLGNALSWSTSAFEQQSEPAPGALGSLIAKRPRDGQPLADAVRLARHDVKVRIVDNIARTEVEEVFENGTDDVLEGIYRFPLPPGAQIERLALEVDGRLEDGAFVDRERAAAIWRGAVVNAGGKPPPPSDDIVWVPGPWRDPALLEWQRGNRFELRIFPIPKRGTRRVVLAYTEVLPPSEGQRRYVYPLPSDPRGSTAVARFSVEVQVRGHDPAQPVAASGYALAALSGSPDVARLGFDEHGFVPHGDLTISYRLGSDGELRAMAYQPSAAEAGPRTTMALERDASLPADAPYVAIALQPALPRRTRYEALDYVLVADTSRSMFGENYRRATRVITRLVSELDRSAQVSVLGCDSTCQTLPGGFMAPGEAAAEAARRFLEGIEPEGASDLALAVERAAALRERRRDATPARGLRVIYVGDGTPTVGPIHPALLEPAIASALPPGASLSAIAIGSDADRGALRVATRAGGGTTIALSPGVSVEDVVYTMLGSSYGQALTDARLELPEGLVQVLPKKLGSVPAGAEELIVARMTRPNVEGTVVLRGQVAGEPFERRYPVTITARAGEANAFVPRLYASVAIAELEGSLDEAAKSRSIELSTRFGVASRYTSLLVLESPAMFSAFGLSNRPRAPGWSGEQQAARSESAAEEPSEGQLEGESQGAFDGAGQGATGNVLEGPSPAPRPAAKARSAAPLEPAPSAPPSATHRPPASRDRLDADESEPSALERERPLVPEQRLVPMRRVWDRVGKIEVPPAPLAAATEERRKALARRAEEHDDSRTALRDVYVASLLAGDLDAAERSAERWASRDPLDVDALTARADVAAQRGDRERAIRMLGSVVDVNPADHRAQWRLARLHRWAGQPTRGCRHALAVAQLRLSDAQLVSDGIGCARDAGDDRSADLLLAALGPNARSEVERLLRKLRGSDELSGDFRVVASWQGSEHDLDVVILHPEGYRVSWLGAPTRALISARDVLASQREGLALRGATSGRYAIELIRCSPGGAPVRGSLRIQAANAERSVPFVLEGERLRVATVTLRNEARLVPLERWSEPPWSGPSPSLPLPRQPGGSQPGWSQPGWTQPGSE
ncbi:MAG TPA: VIT domain-containing protein, partial [Polyangiaceae bacterium]|nr:VIT domain-containing protein [Polyangiaceae bacterium]